jgi:Raf kinase inhibitor-like YbhB/YbcL family protein
MAITVGSEVFEHNQALPLQYSGEGHNISPPLHWSNVPPETKELALIVDDPDAPMSEPFVHWVIYGIGPEVSSLPEGVQTSSRPTTPRGAMQGKNTAGHTGYMGPMPPAGHGTHHYHFTLYALDEKLDLKPGLTKRELLEATKDHVLAKGELVGTYRR